MGESCSLAQTVLLAFAMLALRVLAAVPQIAT